MSTEVLSTELLEIKSRPGVTLTLLLIKPDNPVSSIILFEGGPGKLNLSKFFGKPWIETQDRTFLVRNREDFAKSGLITVLVDVPSDKKQEGLDPFFRMGEEHLQDIKAVVSHLKKETSLPTWLVGTSLGSFSSVNGAVNITEGIDGFVVLSGVTRSNKKRPRSILDMGLEKITIPAMIIYHKDDQCPDTPASDAPLIEKGLVQSPKVEVVYMAGGRNEPNPKIPVPQGCQALTNHGFYGIEKQLVSAISDFIKANSKK
jgi:pimeloyl-ACP methyl ester carboxylesterase